MAQRARVRFVTAAIQHRGGRWPALVHVAMERMWRARAVAQRGAEVESTLASAATAQCVLSSPTAATPRLHCHVSAQRHCAMALPPGTKPRSALRLPMKRARLAGTLATEMQTSSDARGRLPNRPPSSSNRNPTARTWAQYAHDGARRWDPTKVGPHQESRLRRGWTHVNARAAAA